MILPSPVRFFALVLALLAVTTVGLALACGHDSRDDIRSALIDEIKPGMPLEEVKTRLEARGIDYGSGKVDTAYYWSDLNGKVPPDAPVLVAAVHNLDGTVILQIYVVLNQDHSVRELFFDEVDPVL